MGRKDFHDQIIVNKLRTVFTKLLSISDFCLFWKVYKNNTEVVLLVKPCGFNFRKKQQQKICL